MGITTLDFSGSSAVLYVLAQGYNCDAYGEFAYNTCQPDTPTTGGGSSNQQSTSPLANTGVAIAILVTIACLLLLLGLAMRIAKRRKLRIETPPAN